jgi:SAM-dependent methyltransferase
MVDSPYPELKKSHTAAHVGTPWRDHKPPPSAPVWSVIQGYGNYWLLVAAIELGVFDALADGGPSALRPLAEKLRVSEPHLGSLLDSMVVMGLLDSGRPIDEPGDEPGDEIVYELNETAERYLCTAGVASMAELVGVAPGPLGNWTRLADTIRTGRPARPIETDPAAFYIPLVRATFPTQRRAAMVTARMIGFARAPGAPRILDLGAGGAPWAIALLEANPSATAVVNDLPGVIDVARGKVAELRVADRCEIVPGDFRSLELEADVFDVVVLGHVCRTEGIDGAPALIRRLLLADYFPDDARKANPFGVLMGATMMASTERGFTFTCGQYAGWLRTTGFRPVRLVEPIGFNQLFIATKPRA